MQRTGEGALEIDAGRGRRHMAVIFTPDNEPYLGRELLYHFDQVIISAMEVNRHAASRSTGTLSRLQRAACQVIPQGFSIALSIRELIRQGYLLSAEILLRPFVERVATISYLCDNPKSVSLWEEGWPHRKRPPLAEMLAAMRGAKSSSPEETEVIARTLVDRFNSMVHGDPLSALENTRTSSAGTLEYLSSKNTANPEKCDSICTFATMFLIVLMARATQVFSDDVLN